MARTLALAHKIDGMIRAGEFRDLADAARAIGVTRARMTQKFHLMLPRGSRRDGTRLRMERAGTQDQYVIATAFRR